MSWQLEALSLYLQAGYSLQQVRKLAFLPEEASQPQKTDTTDWLNELGLGLVTYLLDYLPLADALNCYLKLKSFKDGFIKALFKSLAYPALQLLLAIALSLVSQFAVLPMLGNLVSDSGSASRNIGYFGFFLSLVNFLIGIFLLLGILTLVVLNGREKSAYLLLLRLSPLRSLLDLLNYQFLNYYLIFYEAGAAIGEIISGLRKLPDALLLNACADRVHFRLLAGESLGQALGELDDRLPQLFAIGGDTGKTVELLMAYIKGLEARFSLRIKKLGQGFQLFSYIYIFLLVLVIYQMMLMPLSLLERM